MTESNRVEEALKWAETQIRLNEKYGDIKFGEAGNSALSLAAEVIRLRSLAKKMAGALELSELEFNRMYGTWYGGHRNKKLMAAAESAYRTVRALLSVPEIQALLKEKS